MIDLLFFIFVLFLGAFLVPNSDLLSFEKWTIVCYQLCLANKSLTFIFVLFIYVHTVSVETSGGNEEEKGLMGLLDESKGTIVVLDFFDAKMMKY